MFGWSAGLSPLAAALHPSLTRCNTPRIPPAAPLRTASTATSVWLARIHPDVDGYWQLLAATCTVRAKSFRLRRYNGQQPSVIEVESRGKSWYLMKLLCRALVRLHGKCFQPPLRPQDGGDALYPRPIIIAAMDEACHCRFMFLRLPSTLFLLALVVRMIDRHCSLAPSLSFLSVSIMFRWSICCRLVRMAREPGPCCRLPSTGRRHLLVRSTLPMFGSR